MDEHLIASGADAAEQLCPQLQGRGIGGALLQGVMDEATAAGASLKLSVFTANPAKELYERLGFTTVGETAMSTSWCMRPDNAFKPDVFSSGSACG